MDLGLAIGLIIVAFVVGIGAAALFIYLFLKRKQNTIIKKVDDAKIEAQKIVKKAELDALDVVAKMKKEFEQSNKEKRQEIYDLQSKLTQRENSIDQRDAALIVKENNLDAKQAQLNNLIENYHKKEKILEEKTNSIISELEKVAGMSQNEAKEEIFRRVEEKVNLEIVQYEKNRIDEAHEKAEDEAKNILVMAINKYAQEITIEKTTSSISLPSEEMKGRVIGRDGRNIKSLENKLGVDILIDDTPETITVSCFDPIRREIAKKTLEALISDGRIQPARIEEVSEKMKATVNDSIIKAGQEAIFKLGIGKMPKELVELIGRLRYRTSYGQNALEHSVEVANLAGVMAAELGFNQALAKRAGLLHDIGKSIDFEVDGSHVDLGVKLAKKYGENDVVVNSIASHHNEVPPKYAISFLVQAADTLSAARPGARSETLEKYIQRLEDLEKITSSIDGVSQSYAFQSGRELRVIVSPTEVSDLQAFEIAKQIKEKIENETSYPGQTKICVIREFRANEVAK